MDELILEKPTLERKNDAVNFMNELFENNSEISGTGALDSNIDNYEEWIEELPNKEKTTRNDGLVPDATYFVVRSFDNKIIGMINIRFELNDYLYNYGGHIGDVVRPTERRKGYGTRMLYLAIEKCRELNIDKVLLTVDPSNIGSIKAIENNLGVLENCVEKDGEKTLRYWVDVEKLLNKGKER